MRNNSGVKLSGDRNECPGCGELFNSTAAFDKHRTGSFGGPHNQPSKRRCRSVVEMRQMGMDKNAGGFWVTHRLAPDARASQRANDQSADRQEVDPG